MRGTVKDKVAQRVPHRFRYEDIERCHAANLPEQECHLEHSAYYWPFAQNMAMVLE
jgi:hypothetical protein